MSDLGLQRKHGSPTWSYLTLQGHHGTSNCHISTYNPNMELYIWCWCWSWYLCWARVGDQTRIYKPDPDQTRTRPGFCWSGRAFPKPQKWKPDETKPNKCTPTTAQNASKTHRGLENRRGDPKKALKQRDGFPETFQKPLNIFPKQTETSSRSIPPAPKHAQQDRFRYQNFVRNETEMGKSVCSVAFAAWRRTLNCKKPN